MSLQTFNTELSCPNKPSKIVPVMSTFDIQPQVEEHYDSQQEENLREMGTAYAEPASEDAWPNEWRFDMPQDDDISPEQAFDILFGYAEERHRNDPCARPAPTSRE